MRQIDADALKTDVRRYVLEGTDEFGDITAAIAERSFLSLVDRQPTIEAEPVRHGRWIPVTERLPEPKEAPVLASHIGGVWNCLETLQLLGTAILDAVAPTAEKENNDG